MGERERRGADPVEPDEPQKRMARGHGADGERSDVDAAKPGDDDRRRRVGSAGGGPYGEDTRDESRDE